MLKPLSILWKNLSKKRKLQLGFLLTLMLVGSVAELVSIGSIVPFLVVFTTPEKIGEYTALLNLTDLRHWTHQDPILLVFGFFVFATIISAAIRTLLLWIQINMSYSIGADYSREIYRRTLHQPYIEHVNKNSSEVIADILGKVSAVVRNGILPVLMIINSLIILTVVFGIFSVTHPQVAMVVMLGFGSIYCIVILSTRSRLRNNSFIISSSSAQVLKALQEGLGGIRNVIIDGTQDRYCTIYAGSDNKLRRAQAANEFLASSPRLLVEAIGIVLIGSLCYVMTRIENDANELIPIFGALALGAQRLMPSVQQLYQGWAMIKGGQALLVDVANQFLQPFAPNISAQRAGRISFRSSLHLDGVSYRYPQKKNEVLKTINLEIRKGSKVGIMGKSGEGKSTLVDILMGLLTPTRGLVKVDNVVIGEHNIRSFQNDISHVPQLIYLADVSIAENIALGVAASEIDIDRVKFASKIAAIDSFIESLDDKYDTIVGERGARLSGGQVQRIGIARALYKRSSILIIDEGTSAIDSATESQILRNLKRELDSLTIIMIAHRLSTLENCNEVYYLDHGSLKKR